MKASILVADIQQQIKEHGDCELNLYLDDRRFTKLTVQSINHSTLTQTGEPVLSIEFKAEVPE
jgi:hypothetical protein